MWKQKVFPNLDDSKFTVVANGQVLNSWLGWCLAVTQKQYGVAPFAPTALKAWEWNPDKHADYDLPNGMFVPIFWDGDRNNWGHIAIGLREGNIVKIWSSPWRHKPYLDYFMGETYEVINRVARIYGMGRYVGWSTMLNTTRIIEWVEPSKPKPLKSNEEICTEVWQGKWGNGKERWNKLKAAGYDPKTIQGLIDKGVGKFAPEPPKEEPKNPEKPEMPSEPPKMPSGEEKPKDDTNIITEPEKSPKEPPVTPNFPETEKKPENAPVAEELHTNKTKTEESRSNDEPPKTGGDWLAFIVNLIKQIVKVLTTKKEK